MKEALIHHHLGLGDHLMCNAIVRKYAKIYDMIYLFVFTKYIKDIKYMYRDLNNIKYCPIGDEEYTAQFKIVNSYKIVHPQADYLKIGHDYLNTTELPADQAFYKQTNTPWENRYKDFYIKRDLKSEQTLFDYYNPDNENYVFVHQDSSRPRLTINKSHIIKKDLKLIEIDFKPEDKLFNFFHYMKLMENATESHYVDSAFKCLADSFIFDKSEMYFHKIEDIKNSTTIKNHWNIISYN